MQSERSAGPRLVLVVYFYIYPWYTIPGSGHVFFVSHISIVANECIHERRAIQWEPGCLRLAGHSWEAKRPTCLSVWADSEACGRLKISPNLAERSTMQLLSFLLSKFGPLQAAKKQAEMLECRAEGQRQKSKSHDCKEPIFHSSPFFNRLFFLCIKKHNKYCWWCFS